jgi:hypothetical protein
MTDIFRGAFFLCNGGDMSDVRVRNNGRRIATLLITGKDLDKKEGKWGGNGVGPKAPIKTGKG